MAGIPYVFTIARAAEMLGEDEDWLHDLSLGMDPEDGHLWVYDAREQQVPAFTAYGIECLQQIIADERKARRAPPASSKGWALRRSPKAYRLVSMIAFVDTSISHAASHQTSKSARPTFTARRSPPERDAQSREDRRAIRGAGLLRLGPNPD